jgi:beta-glucosidase
MKSSILTFELAGKRLGFHNTSMQYCIEPGRFDLWLGGDSQSGLRASFVLE